MLVARSTNPHHHDGRSTTLDTMSQQRLQHESGRQHTAAHLGFIHNNCGLRANEADVRPRSKSAMSSSSSTLGTTTASGHHCLCQEDELERASWRELGELLEHYVSVGRMSGPWREHWTHSYDLHLPHCLPLAAVATPYTQLTVRHRWTVDGHAMRLSTMSPIPEEDDVHATTATITE
jgi:hypothetical protein